ncbi:hypothetical protein SprV_0702279200 [Sparganum proliferum]
MDAYASLIEMGFLELDIQEALCSGCSSAAEVVDFICNARSGKTPSKTVAPLRLSKEIKSQFQSSLPQPVVLSTGESVEAAGSVPNETPAQEGPPPTSGAASSTGESQQQDSGCLQSRYKLLQPSFEAQQAEAKKLATEMRLERLRRAEERDRILRQLEEDKLRKLNQPSANAMVPLEVESPSKPTSSSAAPATSPGGASGEPLRIRLTFSSDWHLPASDASPASVVLPLQPDSKYSDLLEHIQSRLSGLQPRRVLTDGLTTHQTSPFTLPCVTLVVTTDWPRRRLPLDPDHFAKTLREMDLRGDVGIVVDHALAACPFRMPDEPEPEAEGRNEHEEEMDSEPEAVPPTPPPISEEPVTEPPNPFPQPAEVVPEPTPAHPLPPGLTRPPGRAGNAAIFRASMEQLRRPPPTTGAVEKPTLFYQCLPLRELCLNSLVSLLVRSVKASADSGVSFDPIAETVRQSISSKPSSVLGATYALRSMSFPWPEAVGVELVRRLCAEGCFNSRTALLIKNCICSLDLGFYQLATSDLVMCIGRHWHDLVELHLNGLPAFQVSATAIEELGQLKNLHILQLDGLQAVNDHTIVRLACLPKLRVLGVSGTAVTDAGWCSVASVPVATPRPLRALDLSGTSGFTDTGLLHVVRIFPCLKSLMMSNTQVTGLPSEVESPVLHLRRLEVNNCASLVRLPACLIPSADAGGDLVKLSLHGCARLDVGSLLTSLHGHPIQDLDGLPKLPQLTQDHLLEFTKLKFPLRKLSLSVISLSGLTLELLVRLLKPLPATSLQELDLPLKRVACDSDPSALLEELVETLTRLKRLVSLDLGGQAVLFSPTQLARACCGLNSLTSLRAENLSRPQEESLQSVLPSKCTLRIRYHCDTE